MQECQLSSCPAALCPLAAFPSGRRAQRLWRLLGATRVMPVDCQTIQIARCLLARIGAVTRLWMIGSCVSRSHNGEPPFGRKVADASYLG